MSRTTDRYCVRRPWIARMEARSPDEEHRVATPLELLFDLVIVVAVARAATGLHHALASGHAGAGVVTYGMAFFGIWWAWVNFTWFASAYDNDDVVYRLLVLVQLTGALVFAAGVADFASRDLTVGTLGYVVMRLALVVQWLRAAKADPPRRRSALRYAGGVLAVQVAWIMLLAAPAGTVSVGFWVLVACELLVPAWAERAAATTWHPHHIAERYGLFTIITLGESILAASGAVESAAHGAMLRVLPVVAGGLAIVFSCWWLYFDRTPHQLFASLRATFLWGYGHYFVFAAAAAMGAGLSVAVDHAVQRAPVSSFAAGAAVAFPAAIYLLALWVLHARSDRSLATRLSGPLVVAAVLLTPFTGHAAPVTGLLLAGLTAFKIARAARAGAEAG